MILPGSSSEGKGGFALPRATTPRRHRLLGSDPVAPAKVAGVRAPVRVPAPWGNSSILSGGSTPGSVAPENKPGLTDRRIPPLPLATGETLAILPPCFAGDERVLRAGMLGTTCHVPY